MFCRDVGLLIQGIEPNGRIHRDGRLRVKDHIVAINGISLLGTDFYTLVLLLVVLVKTSCLRCLGDNYISARGRPSLPFWGLIPLSSLSVAPFPFLRLSFLILSFPSSPRSDSHVQLKGLGSTMSFHKSILVYFDVRQCI